MADPQLALRERLLARVVKERTRELEQANQMLARFSYLDAVTGIANRRNFDDGLELEWRRLLREGGPFSLVMVDIDNFKAFNDTYGHQKGDECLKAVARTYATPCTARVTCALATGARSSG